VSLGIRHARQNMLRRVCERRKRDTGKGHETGAVAPIAEHFLNFVFTRVVNH